jgi:hypothetical protein
MTVESVFEETEAWARTAVPKSSRSVRLPAAGFGRNQLMKFRFPLISVGRNLSRCVDAPARPYGRRPAERLLAMQ